MPSKLTLWRHWVHAVIMQGAPQLKNRFDVLDRLARIKVGLSAGQKMIGYGLRKPGTKKWSLNMA